MRAGKAFQTLAGNEKEPTAIEFTDPVIQLTQYG